MNKSLELSWVQGGHYRSTVVLFVSIYCSVLVLECIRPGSGDLVLFSSLSLVSKTVPSTQ